MENPTNTYNVTSGIDLSAEDQDLNLESLSDASALTSTAGCFGTAACFGGCAGTVGSFGTL